MLNFASWSLKQRIVTETERKNPIPLSSDTCRCQKLITTSQLILLHFASNKCDSILLQELHYIINSQNYFCSMQTTFFQYRRIPVFKADITIQHQTLVVLFYMTKYFMFTGGCLVTDIILHINE